MTDYHLHVLWKVPVHLLPALIQDLFSLPVLSLFLPTTLSLQFLADVPSVSAHNLLGSQLTCVTYKLFVIIIKWLQFTFMATNYPKKSKDHVRFLLCFSCRWAQFVLGLQTSVPIAAPRSSWSAVASQPVQSFKPGSACCTIWSNSLSNGLNRSVL